MKKIILIFCIIGTINIYALTSTEQQTCAELKKQCGNQCNFFATFNTQHTSSNINNNSNQNSAKSSSSSTSTVSVLASAQANIQQQVSDMYIKAHEAYLSMRKFISSYWNLYSREIVASGALTTYAAYIFTLSRAQYILSRTDTWATWQSNESMTDLLQQPQKKLATQLLADVYKKYINPQNPTDAITPLVQFMNAIEYERKRLKFFKLLATPIEKFNLVRFFPFSTHIASKAIAQEERLAYVANLFGSWAAEQKLAPSTTTTHKTYIILNDTYEQLNELRSFLQRTIRKQQSAHLLTKIALLKVWREKILSHAYHQQQIIDELNMYLAPTFAQK